MLNQDEFKQFIGEVTAAEFPTETISFKLSGSNTVRKLYDQGSTASKATSSKELLQFAPEATAVLEFVKLAAGTFILVKQFMDAWKPKEENKEEKEKEGEAKLNALWRQQLIEAGLSEEKATAIADRFSLDLVRKLL